MRLGGAGGSELERVRVVDLHSPDGLPFPRAPRLKVVRRATAGPCPLVAPTFVDYADLSQPRYAGGFGLPPADVTLTVPLGVQRHIVHVAFTPGHQVLKLALGHPASVAEVTIVLAPRGEATPRALRRTITSLLAATTFHLLRGGRVVFVGPPDTPVEGGAGLVDTAAAELDALLALVPWLGHSDGISNLVRYCAYKDWHATLDDPLIATPVTPMKVERRTAFGIASWPKTRPIVCRRSSSTWGREVERHPAPAEVR
jgi:hypothetical protein